MIYQEYSCHICNKKESHTKPKFDDNAWDKAIELLYKEKSFRPKMLSQKPIRNLIEQTNNVFLNAIDYSIKEDNSEDMIERLRYSAYIFSGFKTYHSLSEAGLNLSDENGKIKSFERFRNDVAKINQRYNHNYLEAEYKQAVASAEMASKWDNFEPDSNRYLLSYRTAGDSKTRPSHQALEGICLPKDDAFWDSYLPPNGWGCRCDVVEVLSKDYQKSDSNKAISIANDISNGKHDKIFRFNPAKEGRLFPDKHPYFGKKGISHCDNYINNSKDEDNPCSVLNEVIKAREKSLASIERAKYLQEMSHLLNVKKELEITSGKKIKVGFTVKGNKHLYSDTFGRSKYLKKDDLKNLDKVLDTAEYINSSKLTHPRKDKIDHFHYFKAELNNNPIRLNVAEFAYKRPDNKIDYQYFLYSINDIKK